MSALTPEQRSLRASAAADARWARELDRSAAVRPAVEGRLRRLEQEIDPDGVLPAGERRQRAEQLRRSRLRSAALKSVRVRAERRDGAA
jgi:hypothetical protein